MFRCWIITEDCRSVLRLLRLSSLLVSSVSKMMVMNPDSKLIHTSTVYGHIYMCPCIKAMPIHTVCIYQSKGVLRAVGTFVFNAVSMEQIKWPEGVFPQQRWKGWVQRDYCESFMTDLITPSWLLCEIFTPKEHGRCDSYQNLFIVHPLQIMSKYQDSVKGTHFKSTGASGCCAPRPDLKTMAHCLE